MLSSLTTSEVSLVYEGVNSDLVSDIKNAIKLWASNCAWVGVRRVACHVGCVELIKLKTRGQRIGVDDLGKLFDECKRVCNGAEKTHHPKSTTIRTDESKAQ